MVTYCTVCMNNNRKNKNISYFNYPKDSTRRHEWLKAVGRADLLLKLMDDKTRQQYRICEDHFERTCIKFAKNRTVKYLFYNAFPTLNLPSSEGANSSRCETLSTQENQKSQIMPVTEISSSSNNYFNKLVILEDQTSPSIQTDADKHACESRSAQTALHLPADTPRKRKLTLQLREAENIKKCDLDSGTKEDFFKLCDKFMSKDKDGQRFVQPTIAGSTNMAAGSVDQGIVLDIKDEPVDMDLDIGPTVLQHMDSHYRTNQSKKRCARTPSVQEHVLDSVLSDEEEESPWPPTSTSPQPSNASWEALSDDEMSKKRCVRTQWVPKEPPLNVLDSMLPDDDEEVSPWAPTSTSPQPSNASSEALSGDEMDHCELEAECEILMVGDEPPWLHSLGVCPPGKGVDEGRGQAEGDLELYGPSDDEEFEYEPPNRRARRGMGHGPRGESGGVRGDMYRQMYPTDDSLPAWLAKLGRASDDAGQTALDHALARQDRAAKLKVEPVVDDIFAVADDVLDLPNLQGDPTCDEFNWSPIDSFVGARETFLPTETGPTRHFATGYDALRAIWNDDILNVIVEETNRYAAQILTIRYDEHSPQWCDTNVDEILLFIGFYIALGIHKMPTLSSCFTNDPVLRTDVFRTMFTRNRFFLLLRCLHFVDNNREGEYIGDPKIFKLHPIVDHLNAKFKELYTLGQNVAIDESLTLWKGELSFGQFVKTKAARCGIKTFELCDSATGYLWSFFIYTGKASMSFFERKHPGCRKTTALVLDLMEPLLNKGYTLYMDSWFNSPLLARYLKKMNTDCVGTLRGNSSYVPAILNAVKLKEGEFMGRHCGDLAIMAVQDTTKFLTISTYHGAQQTTEPCSSTRMDEYKPLVVRDYNLNMGGVDRKDQMLEPYLIERKRMRKWYMKMFKRLLNVSILNSRILVEGSDGNRRQHLDFRLSLVKDIMTRHLGHAPRQPVLSRSLAPTLGRDSFNNPFRKELGAGHFATFHFNRMEEKVSKNCVWCTMNNPNVKRVRTMCDVCNVHLCLVPCFKLYHTTD